MDTRGIVCVHARIEEIRVPDEENIQGWYLLVFQSSTADSTRFYNASKPDFEAPNRLVNEDTPADHPRRVSGVLKIGWRNGHRVLEGVESAK
jgi:hypothetical protein